MNVILHHRTRCTGADGTHIRGVADGFRKLGHQVDIISPWGIDAENQKHLQNKKSGTSRNLLLRMPRVFFELSEILYNIPAFLRLLYRNRTQRCDIIYERYALLNMVGFLISKLFKIPLFLEVNFTTNTQIYPERTKYLLWLTKHLEKTVFRHAAVIIAISDRLKSDVASIGSPPDKIVVLPNAVDTQKFYPRQFSAEIKNKYNLDDKQIIGFVGSFYPWHGVDFLIDAFQNIAPQFKDARLMLIGDGQMWSATKERVQKENMSDKVVLTGPVSHKDLPQYLAGFDIGTMPDSNNYGSPMKIFEYMAMGKPIVAPGLEPIEAVIENGRQGLLFARRNQSEFEKALIRLLKDSKMRRKMGQYGRQKVLAEHTWDKNVEKILQMFEGQN